MNKIHGLAVMIALAAIISGPTTISSFAQTEDSDMNMTHAMDASTIDVRDSAAILLEGKTLPAGDYIHLYDSTPYHIMNGHIAVKAACDDDHNPAVSVLIGQAPNLAPADLEYISELSQPGKMCIYHVDLMSTPDNVITDVAIKNGGNDDIKFGPTSSVVIGVNEVMEGAEEHSGHDEEETN